MPVESHIERPERAITLKEWQTAVAKYPNLRKRHEPVTATNPHTGEVISIPSASGDVDLLHGSEWVPAFRWREGAITFEPIDGVVVAAAERLAADLGARVVYDESGEESGAGQTTEQPAEPSSDFALSFLSVSALISATLVGTIVWSLLRRSRRKSSSEQSHR